MMEFQVTDMAWYEPRQQLLQRDPQFITACYWLIRDLLRRSTMLPLRSEATSSRGMPDGSPQHGTCSFWQHVCGNTSVTQPSAAQLGAVGFACLVRSGLRMEQFFCRQLC